jgi:regulation of enolase protein 1 (concanavalin A-like superfamily)/chitodextrinase
MQQRLDLFRTKRVLPKFKTILKGVNMRQRRSLYVHSLILMPSILVFLVFFLPTLVEADAGTFDSDDFNSFNLDTDLWTFSDPVGDATLMMTGTNTLDAWVSISVPAGTSHEVWTGESSAPRIMQSATDTDFELEVKFESGLSQKYQMQGVLVEQDEDDFLRFNFHSDGSSTMIFATSFISGTPTYPPLINSAITGTNAAPLYMRVKRQGDLWTQSYSYDGLTWTPSISFTHALTVNWVGPFVGNSGVRSDGLDSPAHTGDIDYFFNTADPFVPGEDGGTAVDTTPPFIYNVQDIAGQTKLRVNWSTDEPATGTVQYGETSAYELGSVSHTDFALHHSLLITDLQPTTTYTYQVVSKDSSDNSSSENFVVTTDVSGTSPGPVVDIWYGSDQLFGDIGNPQQWINVLGNVSDPEGVASLSYSLNGGPESLLSIGPDMRRLASEGDFNVEIAYADLLSGPNQVVITATDELDSTTVETVTVEYVSGNVWPLPYSIDWSSVITLSDAAQVVDGLWALEPDGIRPDILGYDRIIAMGDVDVSWHDYEITVPITVHSIDAAGFNWPSVAPGFGMVMRWKGHTNSPVFCLQPHCGWRPSGATTWYGWDNPSDPELTLQGNNDVLLDTDPSVELSFDTCYNFKMRVETVPGVGGFYRAKVWEDGQTEPSVWNLEGQEDLGDPQEGSLLLVAHHVDATFGDVTVVPVVSDTIVPVISDIQATPADTAAAITWTTNEPATSTVAYGPTTAYEGGIVNDDTLVTKHTIVLTDLISDTLYHYQVSSADGSGNVASSTDMTFTTTSSGGPGLSGIGSDDFNACTLDEELWEFIDPLEDGATWAMTGTHTQDAWISISVPGGASHELWEDGPLSPRIMQPANDVDFEVEVKFESEVTEQFQTQGVMVEEDSNHFLRFEFYSDGTDTRIYAASLTGGSATPHEDSVIPGGAPLYMRVKREEDVWTQSYSDDGESWNPSAPFTHTLSVTSVGVYAGNAGTTSDNAPAHTGLVDYFFNTAFPVDPEDADRNTLTVNTVGNGAVTKEPNKTTYDCDEDVTLTATPDTGGSFIGWSGDLSGVTDPVTETITVTMTGSRVITATFTQDGSQVFLPIITRQYSP